MKKILSAQIKILLDNAKLSAIIVGATESKYRGVEQLEARRAHNPEVVGSSPTPATITESNLFSALFFYAVLSGLFVCVVSLSAQWVNMLRNN